jgi:hypothetical protein
MSKFLQHLSSLAALSVLVAGSHAAAAEIYKWTDNNGNVQYGDRPAADGSSERIAITSRATDNQRVAALSESYRDARSAQEQQRQRAAEENKSAEELRQIAAERAEQCTMYRARLQQFVSSRRLYREDENGERVYLDEQQTLAARNEVQKNVEEYCSK